MQTMEEPTRLVGVSPEQKAASRIRQKDQILAALEGAGAAGCTSESLNAICYRYGGRIFDLRKDGWDIRTLGRKGTELARYVLVGRVEDNGQIILPGVQ